MSFPYNGVLDNFNRANENPLANGNWGATLFGAGSGQILTNVVGATAANLAGSYWSTTQFGPSCEAYATLSTKSVNAQGEGVGLRTSQPGATNDGYFVGAYTQTGTDTTLVYVFVNGVPTQIGSTINQEWTAGDGVGLTAIGTTLQVYRRSAGTWATLGSAITDTTYKGKGYISLGWDTDTTGRLDDFGGGTIPMFRKSLIDIGTRVGARQVQG